MSERTLMAIFAHPDDEAFGVGGTLARYAAEGCAVYLVMATRGEAGQIATPNLGTPASLPQVRERELRCACEAFGIRPPIFLDYIDGHLAIINQGQAVAKLVRLIRELRPQVILTFGPDGIYGHYDHVAVHHWATAAYELAADPDCFPDYLVGACAPHRVDKLYYHVLSEEQVAQNAGADGQPWHVLMDGIPFYFQGTPRERITTVIDTSAYTEAKRAGILCHTSQLGPNSRWVTDPEGAFGEESFRRDTYVLARSTLPRPTAVETDLFEGLH